MADKPNREQLKKAAFLAAILAVGVLVFVLFGTKTPETVTFTPAETAYEAAASPTPGPWSAERFLELLNQTALTDAPNWVPSESGSNVYTLAEGSLTLSLSGDSSGTAEIMLEMPLTTKIKAPSGATPVEEQLAGQREAEREKRLELFLSHAQLLAQTLAREYSLAQDHGNAFSKLREAMVNDETESVRGTNFYYELSYLYHSEERYARVLIGKIN